MLTPTLDAFKRILFDYNFREGDPVCGLGLQHEADTQNNTEPHWSLVSLLFWGLDPFIDMVRGRNDGCFVETGTRDGGLAAFLGGRSARFLANMWGKNIVHVVFTFSFIGGGHASIVTAQIHFFFRTMVVSLLLSSLSVWLRLFIVFHSVLLILKRHYFHQVYVLLIT